MFEMIGIMKHEDIHVFSKQRGYMFKNKSVAYLSIIYAMIAALFYGFSAPLSKLLLNELSPYLLSSLLYFGAGFGMLIVTLLSKKKDSSSKLSFQKSDMQYIILMILLDIIAPILLMFGLLSTNASTASLLNNFEIVFTAIIAMIFFKEMIGKRMWLAISFIIVAGGLLSFEDFTGFELSLGALLVLAASLSWGLENNCTRMLAKRNPIHVVIIKGLGSGLGSLLIALMMNEVGGPLMYILLGLLLGFFSYGMSLYFYISAQRHLGAARTSAYYAIAPFAGALFSFLVLRETLSFVFVIAFIVMAFGAYVAIKENHE